MSNSPNILWICSDQQRWDTLGCYGNEFVKTPNLDRLAENGAVFHHAYSQHPMCTPSRASFLTGRYPRTARCIQNGQEGIPEYEVLVTRMLAGAGYDCGLSGKLHLSPGFSEVATRMERRIDDGYRVFHWSHHPGPGWEDNEYEIWMRERGANWPTGTHPGSKWVRTGFPEESHQTTWCAEKAIDFIREHKNCESPWLFSVNIFDPHPAFDPPAEYLERYEARLNEIPLPNHVEGELQDKPASQQRDHLGAYGSKGNFAFDAMEETDHRLLRAAYWAMCDLIDNQVGRMLNALEETNQLENTVVLYMSDHGEMLGDHGIYMKGAYFYDCAVRVPLIFSWPGHIENINSQALVELIDLPQTLLDAAGLEHHPGMQGKSLWPILSGQRSPDEHREDVYCESYSAYGRQLKGDGYCMTMLRTHQHKLTVDHRAGTGELYDLETEPSETHNLWEDDRYAGVKSEMLLRLTNRMAQTADPLPRVIAPY